MFAWNRPTRQFVQKDDPAVEYEPAAQIPVTAVSPVVAQYDPAVQSLQSLNPVVAAKEPAEQLVQLDDDPVEL